MKRTCPICQLEFDAVRWSGVKSHFWNRDSIVCDNCINDRTRHRIVENYLGYHFDEYIYALSEEGFDKLIKFMALSDRSDFYSWFLREASKNCLIAPNYHYTQTASPYHKLIEELINVINNNFGNEFFDYIYEKLGNIKNFINNELGNESSILMPMEHIDLRNKEDLFDKFKIIFSSSIPIPGFINYIDEKRLRDSLTSISIIFDRLFSVKFDVDSLSEEEFYILVHKIKSNKSLDAWYNFATELEQESIIRLIKSFIYIENIKPISSHHNCSPIIALCKIVLKPFANLIECNDADNEALMLIDWILKNSINRYLPLGGNNFSANSLEEYNEYFELFRDSNAKLLLEEEKLNKKKSDLINEISAKHEEITILEKEIAHNKYLVDHKKQSFKRISTLKELNELNPMEKLEFISRDEKPLRYYPEYLINIDKKYIRKMDSMSKSSLKTKLKSVKKGYYKNLKKFID